MCLQNTVIYSPRWNWDGDCIMPEAIVPSGRPAVPAKLKNRPCFHFRSALPHHNEFAVDEFPKQMTKGDYKKLTAAEAVILKCQIGTSSSGYGGRRPGRAEIWQRT
jgi:hypothetical protein